MHRQILLGLCIRHAALFDQAHSLKLEFPRKFSPLHDAPPVPLKHLTRCLRNRVQAKLKKRYRKQYAHYIELGAFKAIAGKKVADLKLRDLEDIRDQILIDHAPSAAHRAVRQGKEMLSWAWKYNAAKAGLDETQYEWWLRWSFEYKTSKRRRSPAMEEIARTLLIAESHRNLARGEHETYPGTLGALWGMALTGQRTGSFLLIRRDRLFADRGVQRSRIVSERFKYD